jgi:molybdenum cofactor biosynthesis enzyme MoaA
MPSEQKTGCKNCSLRAEIVAQLEGIKGVLDATLAGVKSEINTGFQGMRINIDKIQGVQIKQWESLISHSKKIGVNTQILTAFPAINTTVGENSKSISSLKSVLGLLTTLSLVNLGFLVNMAMAR